MSHTPHELAEEFPEHIELIHQLKNENGHFGRLADEYHEINRQIHRHESRIEPVSDLAEETLRKQRLALKDQISALLRQSAN